jgi:superfamily I DNA/RNA helicase
MKYQYLTFDDLFSYEVVNDENPYNLSTIHKVKGETFEAVLLILNRGTIGPYYSTLLKRDDRTTDDEELRNVYVLYTQLFCNNVFILKICQTCIYLGFTTI